MSEMRSMPIWQGIYCPWCAGLGECPSSQPPLQFYICSFCNGVRWFAIIIGYRDDEHGNVSYADNLE